MNFYIICFMYILNTDILGRISMKEKLSLKVLALVQRIWRPGLASLPISGAHLSYPTPSRGPLIPSWPLPVAWKLLTDKLPLLRDDTA